MPRRTRRRLVVPPVPTFTGRQLDARMPREGHCIMISGTQLVCWLDDTAIAVGDRVLYPTVRKRDGTPGLGVFEVTALEQREPGVWIGAVEMIGPYTAKG